MHRWVDGTTGIVANRFAWRSAKMENPLLPVNDAELSQETVDRLFAGIKSK